MHIAAILATFWVLLLNAAVGYQFLEDGTPLSLGLIGGSAILLFIGTGFIALDTGFRWTGHFDESLVPPNKNIGLYILYQLLPLLFIALFFILEAFLVLGILGEKRPMRRCSALGTEGRLVRLISDSLPRRGCASIRRRSDI